jgi:hypothetical protein
LWLAVALAGFCTRGDLLGVSSTVRTLGLAERCYGCLLDFFHSPAVDLDCLTRLWARHSLKLFSVHRVGARAVLLGDGIKIAKSGRKMPAVKLLHQESDNNTKPTYIMGHSVQVIAMLVGAGASFFAVPLGGRIHEGVKFTNRDKRTLPTKFGDLLECLDIGEPFTLLADAYYACGHLAQRLLLRGCHLLSRARRNAVAYLVSGRKPLFFQEVSLPDFQAHCIFPLSCACGSKESRDCRYAWHKYANPRRASSRICTDLASCGGVAGSLRYAASLCGLSRSEYFVLRRSRSSSRCHKIAPIR